MALEDIFKALERQADRDVEDVLAEARARAAALLSEADIEAQTIRESHAADAEASALVRTTRSLNSARLEARRRLAAVRQQAVKAAFDEARERLGGVRAGGEYELLFGRLLDEALEGVEGEFEVLVDARDEALTRRLLAHKGLAAEVRADLQTSGGLVVALDDGHIFRRNTLEDRFEKLEGMAQADVARILFS